MENEPLNEDLNPDGCGDEGCPYCDLVEFLADRTEEENAA